MRLALHPIANSPITHQVIDILTPLFSTHFSVLFGFALAVLLAVRIVREQRPTGSTFAWLLAILLIPYVGVPLYILLGGRKLQRLAGSKEPLTGESLPRPEAAFYNDTERILVKLGATAPTSHNHLEFLPDGENTYRSLIELIRGTRESIEVMTFILGRDEVGTAFIDELCAKAAQGCQVRLLIDALGSLYVRGSFVGRLKRAGGKVGVFMPMLPLHRRWSANLRNHRKLIIADGRRAYIGGMNLASEYMGPTPDPQRWSDFGMIAEGPVVAQMQRVFVSDWNFATNEGIKVSAAATAPRSVAGESLLQLVPSGPDVAADPFYHGLLTAFSEAKHRIWIVTPYFIPDGVIGELLELAARLGRDVRVLVPQKSNHQLADLARGSYLRDLTAAGVKFFGYQPGMLHAKMVVIDQALAVTGSANLDLRSLYLNYEIGLFIHSRPDVDRMAAHVVKLLAKSQPITPASADGFRGWLEDAGRLIAPLL